jgi:hypothetical protein
LVEGARASRDASAAIAQAKAAWIAIHEKDPTNATSAPDYIARFEPYSATLKDGVWHVQGTIPPGFHGRAPVMSVCKNDEGAAAGSIEIPSRGRRACSVSLYPALPRPVLRRRDPTFAELESGLRPNRGSIHRVRLPGACSEVPSDCSDRTK